MKEENTILAGMAIPVAIAALVGLGKLLQSDEKLTWRLVFGRMISSGALGIVAFGLLHWVPDAPAVLIWAAAAALSSFGTSVLEQIVHKYIGKPK